MGQPALAVGAGLQPVTRSMIARHRASIPGTQDEIYAPLYDSNSYPSAGQTQLTFFALPIGQGTTTAPGASGTKTENDTNLTNAGLLPKGNSFLCTGLEFLFFPGSNPGRGAAADNTAGFNWNDTYAVMKSGWVRFRIQNRDYVLDGPLINFPPVARLGGAFGITSTLTAGASTMGQIEYATAAGMPYNLNAVYIEPNQSFTVQVNWSAAVTLPSAAAARIFCRLRGRLIRDAQ